MTIETMWMLIAFFMTGIITGLLLAYLFVKTEFNNHNWVVAKENMCWIPGYWAPMKDKKDV